MNAATVLTEVDGPPGDALFAPGMRWLDRPALSRAGDHRLNQDDA